MRNYLVPAGTAVKVKWKVFRVFLLIFALLQTPEIIRLSDGAVIRPSQVVIAGPASSQSSANQEAVRVGCRVIAIHLLVLLFLCTHHHLLPAVFSLSPLSPPSPSPSPRSSSLPPPPNLILRQFLTVSGLALAVCAGLFNLCYLLGALSLRRLAHEICPQPNSFELTTLEQRSKGSQPSRLHTYFFMRYDLSSPNVNALRVSFVVDPTLQKYWSMVVYDRYGLPLPQYVNDENALRRWSRSEDGEETKEVGRGGGGGVKSYEVVIDLVAARRVQSNGTVSEGDDLKNVNEVDVGAVPCGYAVFRLVHPVSEDAARVSAPHCKEKRLFAMKRKGE